MESRIFWKQVLHYSKRFIEHKERIAPYTYLRIPIYAYLGIFTSKYCPPKPTDNDSVQFLLSGYVLYRHMYRRFLIGRHRFSDEKVT